MSIVEGQHYIPKSVSEIEPDAPRVAGVEFGTLPESIDPKEIFAGTVTALLDLRQFIEDELECNPDFTPEMKKKIEQAGATVYTFFTTLIGIDPISQKPTEFNSRSLNVTLAQVPENVFQAWHYLCRTVPQAQECLCADPKKRSTSESFPEQYGLPYVMVQRALRTLAATNQDILQKNPAAERVYSLLDAKNRAARSTIDRSKPFPVKPEDVTPDRIRWASVNLEELLEERREHLPAEVQADVTLVSSFFRVSIEPALAKERLDAKNLPPEEHSYYENVNNYIADPARLNMTVIPSNIIEAVARLSLADHTIHLALLGHNIRNVGQVLDSSGNRVSSLDRPFAYHPITVAAHNTIERDKLGLATIHELYRLDDVLSMGNHSGAVEVVSATQYAKLADQMGNTVPKQLGWIGRTWKLLTTPIGELREQRRTRDREARDAKQIERWMKNLSERTLPEALSVTPVSELPQTSYNTILHSIFNRILDSLAQEPHLQTRPLMEAIIQVVEKTARINSPEYAERVSKELSGKQISGAVLLDRIRNMIADVQLISTIRRRFTELREVESEADWQLFVNKLTTFIDDLLTQPFIIVDTVASDCVQTVGSCSPTYNTPGRKARGMGAQKGLVFYKLKDIMSQIEKLNPVEQVHNLRYFLSFDDHLVALSATPSEEKHRLDKGNISIPTKIETIEAILKYFPDIFHTPEVLQDVRSSLIVYAATHGGKDFCEELSKRLGTEKKLDAKILDKHTEFVKINLEWIGDFRNLADHPKSMYVEDWDELYRLAEDMNAHLGQAEVSSTALGLLEEKAYLWSKDFLGDSAGRYFQRESVTVSAPAGRIRLAIAHCREVQQLIAETAQKVVADVQSYRSTDDYDLFVKVPSTSPSSTAPHLPQLDVALLTKFFDSVPPQKIISLSLHRGLVDGVQGLFEAEKKYSGKGNVILTLAMERCIKEEWRLFNLAERIATHASTSKLRMLELRLRKGPLSQKEFDDFVAEFAYRDTPRTIHAGSNFRYDRESILFPFHDKNFVPALQALHPSERARLFELIGEINGERRRKLDADDPLVF